MKTSVLPILLTVVFLLKINIIPAQQPPLTSYGLSYIGDITLFRTTMIGHPEKQMISLSKIPGLRLNLRYASENNFLHKSIYPEHTTDTYLRKPAYEALNMAVKDLNRQGLTLVVFDAYRPYSATITIWNVVKDDRYAANPVKGSAHNRGSAVDLTLAELNSRSTLPMPTDFDNFSDSANQNFTQLDSIRMANRALLKKTMEKYGFVSLSTEWWHFSWQPSEQFEILDLSFLQLENLSLNGKK